MATACVSASTAIVPVPAVATATAVDPTATILAAEEGDEVTTVVTAAGVACPPSRMILVGIGIDELVGHLSKDYLKRKDR